MNRSGPSLMWAQRRHLRPAVLGWNVLSLLVFMDPLSGKVSVGKVTFYFANTKPHHLLSLCFRNGQFNTQVQEGHCVAVIEARSTEATARLQFPASLVVRGAIGMWHKWGSSLAVPASKNLLHNSPLFSFPSVGQTLSILHRTQGPSGDWITGSPSTQTTLWKATCWPRTFLLDYKWVMQSWLTPLRRWHWPVVLISLEAPWGLFWE